MLNPRSASILEAYKNRLQLLFFYCAKDFNYVTLKILPKTN